MREVLILGHGPPIIDGNPNPRPRLPSTKVTTLDYVKWESIDVKWNLEKFPLPFRTNQFDEVWAFHVIEHVSRDRLDRLMEEIHRITKKGGLVWIKVPFHSFFGAHHQDHKTEFIYTAFNKYEPTHTFHGEKKVGFWVRKKQINFGMYPQTKQFNWFFNPIVNAFPIFYERFFCWIFPCEELEFDLETIKA